MKYYNDLNSYLKSIFGYRIHKITVDTKLSCPNRDGTLASGGCTYCNKKGSGIGLSKNITISKQIKKKMNQISKRFKAKKFIVYFQSFSNTYSSIDKLNQLWNQALKIHNVVGISIGTRPDCINKQILNLLDKLAKKYLIWLEYGLQSSNNKTLKFINRGHDVNCFTNTVKLTKKKNINVCVHVILGLPGETKKTILETADFLSKSNIDGIKFHLLYIIKDTPMEHFYKNTNYKCLKQKEYVTIICDFIERLPKNIIIHRLNSKPHRDELIAPLWAMQEKKTTSMIHNLLKTRNTWQGKKIKKL